MNNLIMQIPIKPLSVNSKFTINRYARRIVKSTKVYKFEDEIERYLVPYKVQIKNFVESLDRNNSGLIFELVLYVPKSQFFTSKGHISMTCIDASNALKIIEDTVYKNLSINDGLNLKVSSEKRPYEGEDWITVIAITKVTKPKVDPLDSISWGSFHPSL